MEHLYRYVLSCSGCHNRVPHTGWLKQQKFIFLLFWRLKVWDQGVGRVISSSLVNGCVLLFVFTWASLCVCLCLCPNLFLEGHQSDQLGPTHMLHFTLIISLKNAVLKKKRERGEKMPSLNMVSFWHSMGYTSTYEFEGNTNESIMDTKITITELSGSGSNQKNENHFNYLQQKEFKARNWLYFIGDRRVLEDGREIKGRSSISRDRDGITWLDAHLKDLERGSPGGSVSWASDSWFWLRLRSQDCEIEPCVKVSAQRRVCLGFSLSSSVSPSSLPALNK